MISNQFDEDANLDTTSTGNISDTDASSIRPSCTSNHAISCDDLKQRVHYDISGSNHVVTSSSSNSGGVVSTMFNDSSSSCCYKRKKS